MKKTILILLLSIATNLTAQKDTLYFNSAWNKVTDKTDAAFFRPLPLKKVGDLHQIKDYYINGNLQMDGYWSDIENETLEGKVSWYYENGKLSQENEYKNGSPHGKNTYYTKEGFLRATGEYKDGKELSKGIFKNDKPWNGTFFDNDNNTLSSYKEGEKHGFFIQYNNNGKVITKQEYDEGQITRLVKSESYLTNKICECEYKKGKPFEGVVCEDTSILFYKNGKIYKKETYNDANLSDQTCNKKGEVSKKTVYHKGKTYQLTYKNGKPFNGEEFTIYNNGFITYKEGVKNGPFAGYTYDGGVFTEGNYKDDSWDGIIHFYDNLSGKKTSCVYENGKPINGTAIKYKCITNYKNGLKSGLEQCNKDLYYKINNDYQLVYDSITQYYNEGKLNGKVQYFKAGKLVNQGVYEQNHKIEGTFYVDKTFQNLYENAKLVESTYYADKYRLVDTFKDYLITKEITYKDDEIRNKTTHLCTYKLDASEYKLGYYK